MKIPHDKFCVLPWVSLEASPIGTVRPCCLARDEIVDAAGNKFELSTSEFKDIQSSEHMRSLREEFLAGKQPETCSRCWSEESAGRTSKRMHTLDRLKHMNIEDGVWTNESKPLMFLDLKLGNICNLKCRICGSWSSSTFATEELQYVTDKKSSFHYTMLRKGAWPRENQQFWQEIAQVSDQIKYIEFTGGEPFMIQEHFDLLEDLVNQGIAQNIEIHYNTNGTQYPEKAIDIWQHFKLVEIAFSIDDVGSRFEYQRSNASWAEVNDNLQKFKELQSNYRNIRLQACCTVNIFNVCYLDTVAEWIYQQNFDFVYWNMLHDAPWLCIANLPNAAKQRILTHVHRQEFPVVAQPEIANILNFMISRAGTDGQDMLDNIRRLDQRRDQSLAQVQPEFARAIGYE